MTFTLKDFAPAKPRKARRAGSTGRTLEKLVLASQSGSVRLVKVPNGTRWIGKGKTVPVKSPVDFAGVAFGRPIFFDAKECGLASFHASTDHLAEHQRQMLLTMGEAGAVAGLLILANRTDELFWLSWPQLKVRKPTYPWAEMLPLGTAMRSVNWATVLNGLAFRSLEAIARATEDQC